MTTLVETTIYIETPLREVAICITGNVEPGADAATDCYGRPTEFATAPDAYATYIQIGGIEYTDDEICDVFGLDAAQWSEMVFEALMEEYNNESEPYYDDDLPF